MWHNLLYKGCCIADVEQLMGLDEVELAVQLGSVNRSSLCRVSCVFSVITWTIDVGLILFIFFIASKYYFLCYQIILYLLLQAYIRQKYEYNME